MLRDLLRSGLDQQADFPVAGVVPERNRRAVWIANAPLSAEDQVLIAQDPSRIKSHSHALGQPKQVTAAPVPKDFIAQRQLTARAVGAGPQSLSRR